MYKPLFTLCLLFCSLAAFSQKIHITDSGNVWKYAGYDGDGNPWGEYAYFSGDTIINSLKYKKIQLSYFNPCTCTITGPNQSPCSCTPGYNGIGTGFIREDTLAGKVYCYSPFPFSGVDTAEHLLYDYNVQPGDTINLKAYYGPTNFFDSVGIVDSFLYNGYYYKIITLYARGQSIPNCHYTYFEGMGCPANAFHPSYVTDCFEGGSELLCFSVKNMPVSSPYFPNCFLGVSSFSNTKDITIGPNPVGDELNITLNGLQSQGSLLRVYDMNAKCIYQSYETKDKISIQAGDWKSGIYEVQLIEGGEFINRKIIKE